MDYRFHGLNHLGRHYIEDIYFCEVNTKHISSSVLKTSEVSRVCSTNEDFDVFNSRDDRYLVFTEKNNIHFILSQILFLEGLQLIINQASSQNTLL